MAISGEFPSVLAEVLLAEESLRVGAGAEEFCCFVSAVPAEPIANLHNYI
jgi:hypothetical protein